MKFSTLDISKNSLKYAKMIDSYREIYDSIVFDEILEPLQLLMSEKDKMTVKITNHLDLIAWQKEIAYSCIVKLRKTEESILSLFQNKDLYSISILVRHHMELCGLLSLSVEVLMDSLQNNDFDKLERYVSKTWFGSSFYNNLKFRDSIEAFFTTETVTISAMIKSLDKWIEYFQKNSDSDFPVNMFSKNYSWLCQIAHPNSASSAFFANAKEVDRGHIVKFNWTGDFAEKKGAELVLSILYFNLTVGLTNYYLLMSYQFSEDMEITQDEKIATLGYHNVLNRFNNKKFG
ncbi:MAG: hypothetical protein NTY07_19795 [Bacteroidia bacterium]|nr:hypothetical protein [Bacteroidia bacterium]